MSCPNLRRVSLNDIINLSTATLFTLLKCCAQLTHIEFCGDYKIAGLLKVSAIQRLQTRQLSRARSWPTIKAGGLDNARNWNNIVTLVNGEYQHLHREGDYDGSGAQGLKLFHDCNDFGTLGDSGVSAGV